MNNKWTGSRWSRVVLTVAMGFTCLALLTPTRASAQFYVRQPDVEKGVSEIEEHGAVYVSPGDDEALRQSHEIEFKRGLTDRAQLIVEGFFEQPIGEGLQATEFEIGGAVPAYQSARRRIRVCLSHYVRGGEGCPGRNPLRARLRIPVFPSRVISRCYSRCVIPCSSSPVGRCNRISNTSCIPANVVNAAGTSAVGNATMLGIRTAINF